MLAAIPLRKYDPGRESIVCDTAMYMYTLGYNTCVLEVGPITYFFSAQQNTPSFLKPLALETPWNSRRR